MLMGLRFNIVLLKQLAINIGAIVDRENKMKFVIVLVAVCGVIYSEAKPMERYDFDGFDDPLAGDKHNFDLVGQGGVATSDISECHGISCPSGTVACSKSVKTSTDKRTLLTTLQCEDIDGNVLNSATKSSENPFENTQISSFSFTGHYNYQGGTAIAMTPRSTYRNTYYNNNNYNSNKNNDEVEVFRK